MVGDPHLWSPRRSNDRHSGGGRFAGRTNVPDGRTQPSTEYVLGNADPAGKQAAARAAGIPDTGRLAGPDYRKGERMFLPDCLSNAENVIPSIAIFSRHRNQIS